MLSQSYVIVTVERLRERTIILCTNKRRLTQVHLENGRQNGERDFSTKFYRQNALSTETPTGMTLSASTTTPEGEVTSLPFTLAVPCQYPSETNEQNTMHMSI